MNISDRINQLTLPSRLMATFVLIVLPLPLAGGISVLLWHLGRIDETALVLAISLSLALVVALGVWAITRLPAAFQTHGSGKAISRPSTGARLPDECRRTADKVVLKGRVLFDVFMAHVPALAFIKDAQGQYIYINAACGEVLNRPFNEVIGRTDHELWPEDTAQSLVRNDEQITGGGQLLSAIESIVVGAETRCYLVTKFPIANPQIGNLLGGIAFDITDKVRAEEDKARLEQQLIQSQKMEAIGTLAGGIAHDFNNVLAAIMGYAELAQLDTQPGSTVRDELDQVLAATHRAKELVRQILSFSRRNNADRKPLEPKPLIKEALNMLRASIPSTIQIRQALDAEGVQVLANPTQLHQVIMNLCTNAAHAMEEDGGLLEVRTQKISLSGATAGRQGVSPGRYLELQVSDTGHGIPASLQTRIFDPYFTTKAQGKGTGMGLAVARGIVQSHGGSIDVESRTGKGTRFTILLPATSPVAQIPAREKEVLPRGRESILFVDDEAVLVELGQQMLTRLGYRVTSVDQSLDAIAMVEKDPFLFDLVITDTTMPHMTGDVLAACIKKIRPELPVIMCTGYSEQITPQKAEALGIAAFLMKPLAISDLAHTLRQVLASAPNIGTSGPLAVESGRVRQRKR